jgi:predicted nucleic acid-binding protein
VTALLDTSVLIDYLRGRPQAVQLVQSLTETPISSEVCRVELLQGLRADEERDTVELMAVIDWIPVVEPVALLAGELGRRWRPSHSGIDAADLIIAATAQLTDSLLLTLNVRHFPMVMGLQSAY